MHDRKIMADVEIRHFHLFSGLGGGARGFNRGSARVGNLRARFRCIGGVDVDAGAARDFERLAGAPCAVLDLFDRDQYRAFHGSEPLTEWTEATAADIQRAAGGERPHIVFLSAPCKGFSGLLSQSRSTSAKYQALNRLTLRGIWLTLEAWADDPPELMIFENVPRIMTRGRHLLDQISALLSQYGYAVAETTHDCGEIGGLAQSRKRFLLVARHREKVPPFLYEPPTRSLRGVGEVLGRMPLPGDLGAGPMHRVPKLQWRTWVRLAFVEAGKDWRSLNRLRVENGHLSDYLIRPETAWQKGVMGVKKWSDPSGTVAGRSLPTNGAFSVADPRRTAGASEYSQYGILDWSETAGAVSGQSAAGGGKYSVADPRMPESRNRQNGIYRVVGWDGAAGAVTGAAHVAGAAMSVADPRAATGFEGAGKYRVTPWDGAAGTVIAGSTTGQGAFAVQDPRPPFTKGGRDVYTTGGHYGVIPWEGSAGAVTASGQHDNGRWSVADPRLPDVTDRGVFVIRALDDTWHRPFTTLELAALQSLIDPEEHLELDGLSDSAWRERIGNAVPPAAAEAIASVMGRTLLLAWTGETFTLSSDPIWVQPMAIALSVNTPDMEAPSP